MPGVSPARSGRSSPRKAGRAEGRSRGSPRSSARAHSQARRHGALAFLGSVAGCFDNALAESVFLTLECGLFDQQPGGRFKNRQAKLAVFDYLETFYNPRRRHSASARSAPQRARTLRREPCGKSMSAETRCPRKQVNSRVGIDHEIEFESSMEDLDWLRELGVVMQSARGPVPSLAKRVAGGPIRGSWWDHPSGQEIYRVLNEVRASPDVVALGLIPSPPTAPQRARTSNH